MTEFDEDVAGARLDSGAFSGPKTIGFESEKEPWTFDWDETFGDGKGLEIAVKGAWYGVYTLVGLFLFVHLFWVGDWVGKGPPPGLH